MCINKILIIGRGNAGKRYGDILKKYHPSIPFQFHDRKNFNIHRKVLIASANANHLNDILNNCENSEVVMIEKPLITDGIDLPLLQKAIKNKIVFTGDQYYYSKGLYFIKQLIKKNKDKLINIKIIYNDDIKNITKGNPNSYYFCNRTGGILFTLSHVYFVLSFLYNNPFIHLLSVNYDKFVFEGKNVFKTFHSEWCDGNHNIYALTDISKNNLSFNVKIEFSDKQYNLDLINGILYKNNVEFINFYQKRYDLIKCCIDHFISEQYNNQYLFSINSLSLIWKILEKI